MIISMCENYSEYNMIWYMIKNRLGSKIKRSAITRLREKENLNWAQVINIQLNMNSLISALIKASIELLMIDIQLSKEEPSVHQ